MTLTDNIHRLTRGHLSGVTDGVHRVPSLLDQLEAAFTPSKGGGATGGASKTGLPINATALSLWQDITREAVEHQTELIGSSSRNVRAVIRSWVSVNAEWETFLAEETGKWCERIEKLLSPVKPYHPSQPCPTCGRRFHGDDNAPALSLYWMDKDGNVRHPEEWAMDCAGCGSQWAGKVLGAVAWAMTSKESTDAK